MSETTGTGWTYAICGAWVSVGTIHSHGIGDGACDMQVDGNGHVILSENDVERIGRRVIELWVELQETVAARRVK